MWGECFYSAGRSESEHSQEAKHLPRSVPFSPPFAFKCYSLTSSFSSAQFFAEYSLVSLAVKMEETWSSEKNLKWPVLIFLKGIKIAWINTLPIPPPAHTHTHTDIFILLEDKTVS